MNLENNTNMKASKDDSGDDISITIPLHKLAISSRNPEQPKPNTLSMS